MRLGHLLSNVALAEGRGREAHQGVWGRHSCHRGWGQRRVNDPRGARRTGEYRNKLNFAFLQYLKNTVSLVTTFLHRTNDYKLDIILYFL